MNCWNVFKILQISTPSGISSTWHCLQICSPFNRITAPKHHLQPSSWHWVVWVRVQWNSAFVPCVTRACDTLLDTGPLKSDLNNSSSLTILLWKASVCGCYTEVSGVGGRIWTAAHPRLQSNNRHAWFMSSCLCLHCVEDSSRAEQLFFSQHTNNDGALISVTQRWPEVTVTPSKAVGKQIHSQMVESYSNQNFKTTGLILQRPSNKHP